MQYEIGVTPKYLISEFILSDANKSEMMLKGAFKEVVFTLLIYHYKIIGEINVELFTEEKADDFIAQELHYKVHSLVHDDLYMVFSDHAFELDDILRDGFENLQFNIDFYRLVEAYTGIETKM